MKQYLIHLVQEHQNFRRAELESLALLNHIEADFSSHDESRPYLIVQLKDDQAAATLLKRAILAKAVYELWGEGKSMEDLHKSVKAQYLQLRDPYMKTTFKMQLDEYQGKRKSREYQIKLFDSFSYLGFEGKIRLKNPEQTFTILRSYTMDKTRQPYPEPDYCYLGRLVGTSARTNSVIDRYEIAKRPYYGTTTFEAEMSLVTCNLGLVQEGQLVYDPFVGTGSFALAAAHFGGYAYGSDIDFLSLKGGLPSKKKRAHPKRLRDNFKYYGTQSRFGDVLCMDFTNCALRNNLQIDTIVCDPPYGLREGIKVCGTTDTESAEHTANIMINGEKAFLRREYIQPKKQCSLDYILDDLLQFASERLPVGGRLCFWMPAADNDNVPTMIPQHEKLQLLYFLEQRFNVWSRQLLVYVKREEGYQGKTVTREQRGENKFREHYFARLNSPE